MPHGDASEARIYAHLAQAVDDVKSERVQELDAACGDILNELKELEL